LIRLERKKKGKIIYSNVRINMEVKKMRLLLVLFSDLQRSAIKDKLV
jgi:hypothetical protein